MKEQKTDMNITELTNKKKLSSTFVTEHKTEYNYTLMNQTINIYKSKKGVTNLKTSHEKGNKSIQSTTNKYKFFIPVTEKSEECKTI